MQKLINLIALLSGLVSLSVVGGGAFLYLNKDTLIEDAREKVTKAVTDTVTEALPRMIQGAMPEIPQVTGGAIPTPTDFGNGVSAVTGPAIPQF